MDQGHIRRYGHLEVVAWTHKPRHEKSVAKDMRPRQKKVQCVWKGIWQKPLVFPVYVQSLLKAG